MQLSAGRVLSDGEILAIDQASRRVLAEVGVRIASQEVLGFLEDQGLEVDADRFLVRFPPAAVERAIGTVPRRIPVHGRDGSPRFTLGDGEAPRFAAGFNATFTLDPASGRRERATMRDVREYALVADSLDQIDVVGPEMIPHDVPAASAALHAVVAVLDSTVKPLLFALENDRETAAVVEILKIATGRTRITDAPIGVCQFSPSSPLSWNEGTVKGFMRMAAEGFPCTILPGPLAGATSPYTLAATLVQKNAEVLSGVVIAQLVSPGTPLLSYNGGGQMDMHSMSAVLASPEAAVILMAGTELAHHYGLPAHACIPSSDGHCLDERLGIENMMLYAAGLFSGTDLMVNAGMFACGETAALEQLVIDNETIRSIRRIAQGIAVDEEHLCADAFRRVGPGGNFLEDETTASRLRDGEWSTAGLFTRQGSSQWEAAGQRTVVDDARRLLEKTRRPGEPCLDSEQRRRIAEVLRDFEAAAS